MFSITITETQVKMGYCFSLVLMAIRKIGEDNKYWQGRGDQRAIRSFHGNVNWENY